jgi:hypothetical protein
MDQSPGMLTNVWIKRITAALTAEYQQGVDEGLKSAAEIADGYNIDTDDPDRKFHTPAQIANLIRARIGKGEENEARRVSNDGEI